MFSCKKCNKVLWLTYHTLEDGTAVCNDCYRKYKEKKSEDLSDILLKEDEEKDIKETPNVVNEDKHIQQPKKLYLEPKKLDNIELVRKGLLSFIVGFILTIVLGITLMIIFSLNGENANSFFLTGGLPLSWIYSINLGPLGNLVQYEYANLFLDIIFWTFVTFLIFTRRKKA